MTGEIKDAEWIDLPSDEFIQELSLIDWSKCTVLATVYYRATLVSAFLWGMIAMFAIIQVWKAFM